MPDLTLTLPVYLNLDPNADVLCRSSSDQRGIGRLRVVSADERTVSLRLHQTQDSGSWSRVGLPNGWNMVLSAKLATGDDTAYFTTTGWSATGSGTSLAYTATMDFAVSNATWGDPAEPVKVFQADLEIRDATNAVRGTWQFEIELHRENYGSGDTPDDPDSPFLDRPAADNIYLSFDAEQTLTTEQKSQAVANLGGTAIGEAVLQAASESEAQIALGLDSVVKYSAQTLSGVEQLQGRTNLSAGAASLAGNTTAPYIRQSVFASVPIGSGETQSSPFDATGLISGMDVVADGVFDPGTTIESIVGIAPSQTVTFSNPALVSGTSEIVGTALVSLTGSANPSYQSVTITSPSGANSTALSQDGSILSIEDGAPIGASSTSGVAKVLTQAQVVTFLANSSPTFNVLTATTISAASGTFTVGANGDLTATHGKFQGSAGQAGHLILAQGTTPNGTGSSTTLWGIANGIGWRNGTGTAYSLTLPTASGTLALVDGNLGTPTTLTLINATGLPLAGLTGSFTPSVSTLLSPLCTVVITPGESAWSASTISGSAALSAYSNGCRVVSMNASTAGLVRHVFSSNSSHLPTVNSGSGPQVNWGKSWAANWSAVNRCPVASGTKQTIIFGAPTTQADHTLTSKSVRVTIEGNGTNVIASITAYQSGEVQSSTSTLTTDDRTSYAWRLLWNQGTGFTLYRNGTAICTLSTGLPSGNGTALHHNIVLMHTQVSGGATAYECAITSICIDHLA